MKELNITAHRILDVAEYKTQTLGFNAFSYRDIQEKIGIKTASIHYYFPTKQDLAFAMTVRYINRFRELLDDISSKNKRAIKRLQYLGEFYLKTAKQEKFCMCGMLASDSMSLFEHVNIKLQEFFKLNELWLEETIKLAQTQNDIKKSIAPKEAAALFFAALEGGMLIARSQKHAGYLDVVITQAINQMRA